MFRRPALVLFALGVVLVMSSCRSQDNSVPPVENQDRIIQTASLTENPNELLLTWDPAPCETFEGVDVDLDDDFANLTIRVFVDVDNCPPGGFTQTVVDLGEPLGDRRVWDRAFNNTVAITE